MTSEEKRLLQSVVLTLADPKGNWRYAWDSLCKLADLNPDHYQPPLKSHPLDDGASGAQSSSLS